MTLIMLRCKHCGDPIDTASYRVHCAKRVRRGQRASGYVHTDTGRVWCRGVLGWLWGTGQPDVDRLVRDTLAALDEQYTLLWADRDDALTPKQIQVLLDGGNESESDEFSTLEEYEADNRYRAVVEVLRELLDEELFELLDETGRLDEIRWEVEERDDSGGLVALLLTVTRSHLFRFDLGVDVPDYTVVEERHEEVAKEIADAAGLDLNHPPAAAAISSLLAEASYGGRLYVLWYTDPEDAMKLAAPHDPDDAHGRVTFTGANLLVLDSWNGSGHDVFVPMVDAEWRPRRVSIDAARMGGGYSWTDTAGPVASSYAGIYDLTLPTTTGGNPDDE